MNPTKQSILQGEKLLETDKKFASEIASAQDSEFKGALLHLFNERIQNIEARLTKLRAQWAVEFEKESAEANTRMPALLASAKKYIGMNPVAISTKIEAIIRYYEDGGQTYDQETRNDHYYELIQHVRFMNSQTSKPQLKATKKRKNPIRVFLAKKK